MSSSVNVGSLFSVLEIKDSYSAVFEKFKASAIAIEARLKKLEESTSKTDRETKKSKETIDKIEQSYRKVAASLDPVVANTQKFERAEIALNAALKTGIITQDQHNRSLAQAKEKYLSATAHTLTWREEIHNLSGKVSNLSGLLGPFGAHIDNILGNLSAIAGSTSAASKGMITFGAVTATVTAIVTKATAAVRAFIASISGPIIAAFAAIVIAAGLVYGGFVLISKGVNLVNDSVQNGLKTQLIIEKLNYALAANGSASGLSAKQMVEYAESLELVTGRSKEEIVAAETILSRFDSLGREAFPKAVDATLAYAKAMGITADAAANKLGPMLDGNVRSITAAKEAGIVFTAGQRKTLTAMVETGKVVEYQTLLFDILKEKVGETGKGYDNNLTRQAARAKIVLEDFGEGIATEVIPALEDLVSGLIEAAGGWDKIKFVVSSAGREIGDIIRKTIYGIMISYHEWQSGSDQLAAVILGTLSRITGGFADLAPFATFIPGMQGLAALGDEARATSERLGDASLKAGMSAAQHEVQIISLTQKLVSHRTALEGDSEAHVKLGSSIDDVIATNKRQKDAMDSVTQSIEEMQRKVLNLRNAYLAALISTKAYNAEILRQKVVEAILKEENKLRALGLSLQEGQRNAISQAIIDEDLFNRKLKDRLALNEKLLNVMLAATDNIAEKGFAGDFERFTKNAHQGMEIIAQDVEEMLTGLKQIRDLDLDLEFSSRLGDVAPHLRDLEADYLSFLENLGSGFEQAGENAISAGERILTTIGTRFGRTADEIRDKLQLLSDQNLAIGFKDSLAPTGSLRTLRETLSRLQTTTDKTGKSLLSASDAQKIYTRALGKVVEETLDAAGSLLSQIGAITGNSNLSKVGGLFGVAGGAVTASNAYAADPSMMAGLNSVTAWLALFVGMAEAFTDRGGLHFGADIATGGLGSLQVVDDFTYVRGGLHEAQKAAKDIADTIENIVLSFGGQLQSITRFGLIQTGEGWAVSFGGEMRRYFTEFSDAVAWAAHQAISTADVTGVSDEILEAFRNFTFRTLEDLQEFSNFAREYTSYGASELTGSLRTLSDWFIESSRKAYEYGLSIAKVSEEFGRRAQSWRDQVLGIVKSPEEQIHQNVVDFNNWINQQRMAAQIQIDAASGQMLAAQAQMVAAQAMLKGQGMDRDPAMMELFLESQRLFKEAGARLDMWTKALENLPPIITPEEEEAAKKRNRGGGKGKGGQKDNILDWINDKKFDLDTRGMDEWVKRAADISRQYDQQMEQAGKDKKIRAELIALKERELQLLTEEQIAAVNASYQDFTAQANAFQQVRDTASELIKAIEGSAIGNVDKVAMIANVLQEVNNQIEELGLQAASSLFGSLIQDLEKFGASESMLNEARQHMAYIEHTLKIAHYQAEFAILKANGSLSEAILSTLGKAIDFVSGIDPLAFIGNVSNEAISVQSEKFTKSVDSTVGDLEKLKEAFKAAKDDINETVRKFDRGGFGAVAPEKSWDAALSQWNEMTAKAKGGDLEALKSASTVFNDTLDVLEKFSPALFASLAPKLRDELAGLGELKTIKQGNLVITDFEKREQHNETITTLKSGFADLSAHASNQEARFDTLIDNVSSNNQRQQEINIRLARLESANLARK